VQNIQKGLIKLGHPLTANGVHDTPTKKAIAMFQADHGITIDGQATQQLLNKINEEVKKADVSKGELEKRLKGDAAKLARDAKNLSNVK
jgi:peptidoglycan hydrolase-like protein with peptidoglycan-binding domain